MLRIQVLLLFLATVNEIYCCDTKGGCVSTKWIINSRSQQNAYSTQQNVLQIKFSCINRINGVYADTDYNCQLYHICNSWKQGLKWGYSQQSRSCPFGSRYDQKLLNCVTEREAITPCLQSPNLYPTSLINQQFDRTLNSDVMVPVSCPTAQSLNDNGASVCQISQQALVYESNPQVSLSSGFSAVSGSQVSSHTNSGSLPVVVSQENRDISSQYGVNRQSSNQFSSSHGSIHQSAHQNSHRQSLLPTITTNQNFDGSQSSFQSNADSGGSVVYQPTIRQEIVLQTAPGFSSLPTNVEEILGHRLDKSFSCRRRAYGYYADVRNGCRVYHVCTEPKTPIGKTLSHFSYLCNPGTIFDQKFLTCVKPEDSAIPCRQAEDYYHESSAAFAEKNKPTLLSQMQPQIQPVAVPDVHSFIRQTERVVQNVNNEQSSSFDERPFNVHITRIDSNQNRSPPVLTAPVHRLPPNPSVNRHNINGEQFIRNDQNIYASSNQQSPPLSTSLGQGSNAAQVNRVSQVNSVGGNPQISHQSGSPFIELRPSDDTSQESNQNVADALSTRHKIVHNPQIIQTIVQPGNRR